MIKTPIKSVCVFCASSNRVASEFLECGKQLGIALGNAKISLVYGGASIGLMGKVAEGVHERGGKVTGVLPKFFKTPTICYENADEIIVTEDMRERKATMDRLSDAFIVLPGGIGTLEEATEILSLVQLKQTNKPLIFVNTLNFYDGLFSLIQEMVDLNFAKEESLNLFKVAATPEEALEMLRSFQAPELHSKWL